MSTPISAVPEPRRIPVAIVGGGQAGLSMSWHLKQAGIEHVVFERDRCFSEWRKARWDSFCLVTPNWQCRLPGHPYAGPDPQGFMLREEIVDYLDAYVARFDPPVLEGVEVTQLQRGADGRFLLATSAGAWIAEQVVLANGVYQKPVIPREAERLPADILQLHSSSYRNPQSLPPGATLVVGSGQSGCQIAEDIHLAGRQAHLCVGRAPRSPRIYRGREVTDWLTESGYYDIPYENHPQKATVREKTNHYLTGRDGGREIDLRRRALEGMKLHGSFRGVDGSQLLFAPDLRHNLDEADRSYNNIRTLVDQYIAQAGIDAPQEPAYQPPWAPAEEVTTLDYAAAGITSIVWAIGFTPDYGWVDLPVFNGRGHPVQRRGVTPVPGAYFLGLSWQNTWGSGRLADVGKDAEHLLGSISRLAGLPEAAAA
ncbi:MSMEG_0569 family flavin-dependent oxidoreductase [Solimonas sp. SE-A11]|uniref:MSMEG_0569 family flavin-dependent oxidoreductase n=1 Tax=Solimonas sp. SE-A11 TaxID=3054954 RepID=UPI00259CF826|nr:MSMEG_0569 family flavin-dependent oxidoreductase [Solimonas sp. SE-A11]MDM4769483.1 MSMEG_0569 family flavin-dependent oxidoreductase [Solimonas sp. SE-A11]